MTLGEKIVYYRDKRGLTQKALAERMGITPTRLNYWEKDKRYVAYKFDIDISPGKEIFALCANGNELCWEGDVLGIYADIDEVKKAIIEATNLSEFDTEEEINLLAEKLKAESKV